MRVHRPNPQVLVIADNKSTDPQQLGHAPEATHLLH
jgi:hypothetical protein